MSLDALRDFLGPAAPWVVTVAAVLFVLVGVLQGREVTLWPPKIGARPERPARDRAAERLPEPADSGCAPSADPAAGASASPYDREFDAYQAREFYEQIASVYDTRNSGNLVSTHLATIARIQMLRAQRAALKVLDLGGGTGNPIATHFFNDENVEWTYVDFSSAVEARFRRHLDGYRLARKVVIESGDLTQVCRKLRHYRYDLVLLSLVLTSMPTLPDFADIVPLVAPGGSLIITDIGPGYIDLKPYYEVQVAGKLVALKMVPVDPIEIHRQVTAAGLIMTEITALGDDVPYYSFVAAFSRTPIRHQDDNRDNALELVS